MGITKAIVFAILYLGVWGAFYALVKQVIPDEHSYLFFATFVAVTYLARLGFRRLQRRWPAAISDSALVGVSPRLTLGRAAIGTGMLLLWTSVMVVLFIIYQLDAWQTALIWVTALVGLFVGLNFFERRWLQQDETL